MATTKTNKRRLQGRPSVAENGETQDVVIRFPAAMHAAMMTVRDDDGIPMAEQVRRAVQQWLQKR